MTKINNDVEFREALERILLLDDDDVTTLEWEELNLQISDYEKTLNIPKDLLIGD